MMLIELIAEVIIRFSLILVVCMGLMEFVFWLMYRQWSFFTIGTRSVIYGVHGILWHGFFVAAAWIGLYGFTFDPRYWVCFFLHDIGYWGKRDIDGLEGKEHVWAGATIVYYLFDVRHPLSVVLDYLYLPIGMKESRCTTWTEFSWRHSREACKENNAYPSRLAVADKQAFLLMPESACYFLLRLTGEFEEIAIIHGVDQTATGFHTWHTGAALRCMSFVKEQTRRVCDETVC